MRFCPEYEDLWHQNKQLLSFWGWLFQPVRSEEKTDKRTKYKHALKESSERLNISVAATVMSQ